MLKREKKNLEDFYFLLLLLRFKLENYSIIGNNNDFNNCDNKQKTVIITWIQYIQMFKAIK